MPTEAEAQSQILYEIGQALPYGPAWDAETTRLMNVLANQLSAVIWPMYAPMAGTPYRRFLWAKKRALAVITGQLRNKVDAQLGSALRVQRSQLMRNLDAIRREIDEEIKVTEARYRANLPPAVGRIVQASPVMVGTPKTTVKATGGANVSTTEIQPDGRPNPGGSVYTGDPLCRPPWEGHDNP
jgi:hypothetical protein